MAVLGCSNNISKIIMSKDNRNHLAVTDDGILISIFVTGFVKIDPNHTGTEFHFIAEH